MLPLFCLSSIYHLKREQMLLTLSCCHLLSFKYITQTDLFEVSPSYLQITLQILRWIYFIICGMFVPPHRFPRDKVNKRKHDPAACNSASCIASTSQHYGSPSLVEIQLVHWNYLQIILQSSGNHHVEENVSQDTTSELCEEPWKLLCAVLHVSYNDQHWRMAGAKKNTKWMQVDKWGMCKWSGHVRTLRHLQALWAALDRSLLLVQWPHLHLQLPQHIACGNRKEIKHSLAHQAAIICPRLLDHPLDPQCAFWVPHIVANRFHQSTCGWVAQLPKWVDLSTQADPDPRSSASVFKWLKQSISLSVLIWFKAMPMVEIRER